MRLFVHYNDVIMSAVVPQITSLTIVYSTAYSLADQRKHQSSKSLAFVRGIHRWPVNSPHKGPIIWKCSHLMTSSTKTMITALYLQATWPKNYISLVHEISLSIWNIHFYYWGWEKVSAIMMRKIGVFNCMTRVIFQLKNAGIRSHWYNRGCIYYGYIDSGQHWLG